MYTTPYIIYSWLLAILLVAHSGGTLSASELKVEKGHEWHYYASTKEPPPAWTQIRYDDAKWKKGLSGFGYSLPGVNTDLKDMRGKYRTVYVRKKFGVKDYHGITKMELSVVCDGPFVAYINGIEVIRSKKPQRGDPLNLIGFAHELEPHLNVLAIQCSNDSIDSADFSFVPTFHFNEK